MEVGTVSFNSKNDIFKKYNFREHNNPKHFVEEGERSCLTMNLIGL